jgi:hypothetical protein
MRANVVAQVDARAATNVFVGPLETVEIPGAMRAQAITRVDAELEQKRAIKIARRQAPTFVKPRKRSRFVIVLALLVMLTAAGLYTNPYWMPFVRPHVVRLVAEFR